MTATIASVLWLLEHDNLINWHQALQKYKLYKYKTLQTSAVGTSLFKGINNTLLAGTRLLKDINNIPAAGTRLFKGITPRKLVRDSSKVIMTTNND